MVNQIGDKKRGLIENNSKPDEGKEKPWISIEGYSSIAFNYQFTLRKKKNGQIRRADIR